MRVNTKKVVPPAQDDPDAVAGKIGPEVSSAETATVDGAVDSDEPELDDDWDDIDDEDEDWDGDLVGDDQLDDEVDEPINQAADGVPAQELAKAEPVTDTQLADDLFWGRVTLLGNLSERESQFRTDEQRLNEAKARKSTIERELDDLKSNIPTLETAYTKSRDAVVEVARDLALLVRENKLPQRAANTSLTVSDPAVTASAVSNVASVEAEVAADESWRHLATAELLKDSKGIGKRKLESIIDLAPTFGALVDLHCEATKQHKQFHELLPTGCGQGVSDVLQDCISKYWTEAARAVAAASGAPQKRSLATVLVEEVRERAASEPWLPDDCELTDGDSEYVHAGFTAFRAGKPFSELPWVDDERARQWMVGWVSAEVIATAEIKAGELATTDTEGTNAEKEEKPEAVETKSEPKKRGRKPKSKEPTKSADDACEAEPAGSALTADQF